MQIRRSRLQRMAAQYVDSMGDVFWDASDHAEGGAYTDPRRIAINVITDAMETLAKQLKARVVSDCRDLASRVRIRRA